MSRMLRALQQIERTAVVPLPPAASEPPFAAEPAAKPAAAGSEPSPALHPSACEPQPAADDREGEDLVGACTSIEDMPVEVVATRMLDAVQSVIAANLLPLSPVADFLPETVVDDLRWLYGEVTVALIPEGAAPRAALPSLHASPPSEESPAEALAPTMEGPGAKACVEPPTPASVDAVTPSAALPVVEQPAEGPTEAARAYDADVVAEAVPVPVAESQAEAARAEPATPSPVPADHMPDPEYDALASVLLAAHGGGPMALMFTSPAACERQASILARLAIAMYAQQRRDILLVDWTPSMPGLTDWFTAEAEERLLGDGGARGNWTEFVWPTAQPGIHVLSGLDAAHPQRHPMANAALLRQFKGRYHTVLVSAPPVAALEPRQAWGDCDGMYLLLQLRRTSRRAAQRAAQQAQELGVPRVAVVVVAADG